MGDKVVIVLPAFRGEGIPRVTTRCSDCTVCAGASDPVLFRSLIVNIWHFSVLMSWFVALPALANSGFTPSAGESSGTWHFMPSTTTAEQVRADLAEWKRNPVTADGWRQIGGDAGWEYEGPRAGGKTRAQVARELADSRRNPVSLDGWVRVDGEAGWVFVGSGERGKTSPRAGVQRDGR